MERRIIEGPIQVAPGVDGGKELIANGGPNHPTHIPLTKEAADQLAESLALDNDELQRRGEQQQRQAAAAAALALPDQTNGHVPADVLRRN